MDAAMHFQEPENLRSRIIRFIYKVFRKHKSFTFSQWIGILSALALFVYALTQDWRVPNQVYLKIATGVSAVITPVLIYFIMPLIRHEGGKFIFPKDKYIIPDDNDVSSKLLKLDIHDLQTQYTFCFADSGMADKATEINLLSYRGSIWETDFAPKRKRNLSHIQRNNQSMQLVFLPSQEDVEASSMEKAIAFTHILPLKNSTWESYVRGEIADNTFPFHKIISNTCKDNSCCGLLLFSAGLPAKNKWVERTRKWRKYAGDVTLLAIALHLDAFLKRECAHLETVPVMLQNMSKSYHNRFGEYSCTEGKYTKDGAQIICFEIVNPYYQSKD